MFKKRKVLISIGYKKREFEYLSLLAAFLVKAGYKVQIHYFNFEIYQQIYNFQPDFIVLGQVNQNENIAVAKYAKKSGANVVIINQEGTYNEISDYLCMLFGKFSNDYVDAQIIWGQQHKEDITNFSNIDSAKIFVCGTPKFDLYNFRIFKYLKKHRPYLNRIDSKKKTICIGTSFQEADSVWNNVKNNVAYQELGQNNYEKGVDSQKIMREKFVQLAQQLVKTDCYNIIFRLHPLEREDYYQKNIANSSSIIFDNNTSPAELFTVTDFLIHRSSTLATEAWILGIPTISFDPIQNADGLMLPFTKNEPIFNSSDQIIDYISHYFSVKTSVDIFKTQKWKYLKKWYNLQPKQKKFAAEKIVHVLDNINIKPKKRIFNRYIIVYTILNTVKKILHKQHLYEVLGLIKGQSYLNILNDNYILPHQVKNSIQKYLDII